MSDALYRTFLARHDETAWPTPQHTSRIDLPLIAQACRLQTPEYREKAKR
jgi:hypothetical protein